MRIKTININEAGRLHDFKLEFVQPKIRHFNNANLNILVGENGTGKTTILKFISKVFSQPITNAFSLSYDIGINGSIHEVNYPQDTYENFFNIESYPKKIIVSTYSPFEQFDGIQKSHNRYTEYCYVGAMSTKNTYGSTASLSTACMPILTTFYHPYQKKSAAIKDLLREIGITSPPFVELRPKSLLNQRERTRNRTYNDIGRQEVFDLIEKIYSFSRYRFTVSNKRLVPSDLIAEYYIGGWASWLEDVRTLMLMTDGYSPIQTLWFQTDETSAPFPMKQLSSGQLSLFFRFFRMLEVMDDNSIILIDEPETHLHPRWAQKYINLIYNVFGEFNTHFIIATHSPFIAADVPKEYIVGLKETPEGKVEQYSVQDKTMGSDPKEILQEVFHLTKFIGPFALELVNKIHKLLDQYGDLQLKNVDSEEATNLLIKAKSLYNELGESHEKYKIFLKLSTLEKRKDIENVEN